MLVLSAFLIYLLLLGQAVTTWRQTGDDVLERAGLALATGILLNLAFVLSGQPFGRVFAAGAVIAAVGAWRTARRWVQSPFSWGPASANPASAVPRSSPARAVLWATAALIVYILVLNGFRILIGPIEAWDARSIWFFQAKKIWLDGGLIRAGWDHPSLLFSNPDYPKLVPAMAAQLGYLRGYWNEFFPKASLLVLLVPPVLWVFSFRRRAPSFALLVLLFFFSYHEWLSNGYMDGYLAIYSGVALLFAGRYLSSGRDFDLQSACCALGIACSLKNEGLFLTLCLVIGASLAVVVARLGVADTAGRFIRDPARLVVVVVAAAPVVAWSVLRTAWALKNSLTGEPAAAMARVLDRLSDGQSVTMIFDYLAFRANHLWLQAILVLMLLVVATIDRRRVHPGALAASLTAVLHFGGMFVIYLSTPAELHGHLETSAVRAMNTTSVVLLMAIYFLLSDMEAMDRSARTERGAGNEAGFVTGGSGTARSRVLS